MPWRTCSFVRILVLINPALHANNAINGLGFRESIVNRDSKGLERHLPFAIPLGTSDISTTETTGAADTNSIRPKVHGCLNRTLHGATKGNSALELDADLLANAL
jgi:hypothetical protein